MKITTMSSRVFRQNASGAMRSASKGTVFITARGRPTHALLTIEAYRVLTQNSTSIADVLAMPSVADLDFDPPRADRLARPADLG